MLEAEGTPDITGKSKVLISQKRNLTEPLTHPYILIIPEACTLTPGAPLSIPISGVLGTSEADAKRARNLQSAGLWGITRAHQPARLR